MQRGRFGDLADKASRVPRPQEDDFKIDSEGKDYDGDFDISLASQIVEGPLKQGLALPLPNSLTTLYPDGNVPPPVARLVKVSACEIQKDAVKEYLKIPGSARNMLICMRAAERTLKNTSGNTFILGLAYFIASELHWSTRYILPSSPEAKGMLDGDADLNEKSYEDPGPSETASRLTMIHKYFNTEAVVLAIRFLHCSGTRAYVRVHCLGSFATPEGVMPTFDHQDSVVSRPAACIALRSLSSSAAERESFYQSQKLIDTTAIAFTQQSVQLRDSPSHQKVFVMISPLATSQEALQIWRALPLDKSDNVRTERGSALFANTERAILAGIGAGKEGAFILYPRFLQSFTHLALAVESVWSYRHLIHPATVSLLRAGVKGEINTWLGMLSLKEHADRCQEVTAFCSAAKEAKTGKQSLAAYEKKAMERFPEMDQLGRMHGRSLAAAEPDKGVASFGNEGRDH